jgi:D-glucosaminate-6-phosphate ammonia-lyase
MQGLVEIVNAAGKMTSLGASAVDRRVAAAVSDALQRYFDMEQLSNLAGQMLAQATCAEAGMVTASAAAGIVLAVAATIAGIDPRRIERLPESESPNEVVILRAHAIDFGAPIEQMIRLGGGRPVEVGAVNRTMPSQLKAAMGLNTAAMLYVVSHHVEPKGNLPLQTVIEEAHAHRVPVIVDAAAEMELCKYVKIGADLVIYSGQKAIGGPTSGILVGANDLIQAAQAQTTGIGRAMKVSKEAIIGLITALEIYRNRDEKVEQAMLHQRAQRLIMLLGTIPGGKLTLVEDETRPILRVALHLSAEAPLSAADLVHVLEAGDPSIRTRNHHIAKGTVLFDLRTLRDGEEVLVAQRVREALGLNATE